jgi:VanZ family protein
LGSLLILWGPVVAHMALLFFASAFPDAGTVTLSFSDKVLHIAAYAPLGFLILRALTRGRLAAITWPRVLAAVALSVLYGLTDEIHQMFVPGRTADPVDLLADGVGAALGAAALASLNVIRRVYFDDPGTGRFPF